MVGIPHPCVGVVGCQSQDVPLRSGDYENEDTKEFQFLSSTLQIETEREGGQRF